MLRHWQGLTITYGCACPATLFSFSVPEGRGSHRGCPPLVAGPVSSATVTSVAPRRYLLFLVDSVPCRLLGPERWCAGMRVRRCWTY